MRRDAEILWEVASGLARQAAKVSRAARPIAGPLPPLLFFTDPERTPRPWETARRLPAGSGVVLRHFGAPDARDIARRLRDTTSEACVLLLIGLDVELADAVGADGVHLPERALRQAAYLRGLRPGWVLTGAIHDLATLAEADALNAVVLSPVFPAGGASGEKPALGLDEFIRRIEASPVPAYALGGLNAKNARKLVGSGACGLAGVSAIQTAFGPE